MGCFSPIDFCIPIIFRGTNDQIKKYNKIFYFVPITKQMHVLRQYVYREIVNFKVPETLSVILIQL